ncbi:hypothetical protein [Maritalea sp.]|uniref:hypothetical protein n=1 Tax=Maritalea sp. TaxID=2003361 RepID=UPI003EF86D91
MVDRVILGLLPNGGHGIQVSRPGVDVNTAGEDQLMLSMGGQPFQIITSGVLAYSPVEQALVLPDVGFRPFVILVCTRYHVELRYDSDVLAYCKWFEAGLDNTYDSNLYYHVTNVPWG